MYPLDDTIAAVASAPGGAARGIVRVSGTDVSECLEHVFRAADRESPFGAAGPVVVTGSLRLAGFCSLLPCELYLWPKGRSYTGQQVAEIHALGSQPLLQAVLQAITRAGARMAGPGEFTLRAFLAGKIDLTRAEAVLGVVDAPDADRLHVALAQLAGGLAGPLQRLRDNLIDLLAQLEAGFDFADEDLPFITPQQLSRRLARAAENVDRIVRQMAGRSETAAAVRAVLVGRPNTGKSSLFNALSRSAGALVSQQPGTTRDYLTAEVDLDRLKCRLIDTAGIGEESACEVAVGDASHSVASHSVASHSVASRSVASHSVASRNVASRSVASHSVASHSVASRSVASRSVASHSVEEAARVVSSQQSRHAQVQIVCIDSTRPLHESEREQLARPAAAERIVVLTKVDAPRRTDYSDRAIPTSSISGEGLDSLRAELREAVLAAAACGTTVVAGTAVRCRESLRLAAEALQRARGIIRAGGGEEFVAADIRAALDELGKVVGTVYTDDVLDRVFSRFCIGK